VTHSAALTTQSCISPIFCNISGQTMYFTSSHKKNSRGVKFGERGSPGMGPPLPIQWSGNSLPRKTRSRREKWGGAPSNRKTVPTGTWHKAVFTIARKLKVPHFCGKSV